MDKRCEACGHVVEWDEPDDAPIWKQLGLLEPCSDQDAYRIWAEQNTHYPEKDEGKVQAPSPQSIPFPPGIFGSWKR